MADSPSSAQVVPAPWHLYGSAYVLFYRFPKAFAREQGFMTPSLANAYKGGMGTVILVSYDRSPVGRYHELLFSPGRFKLRGKTGYGITKIYVDNERSLASGRANWGIPKQFAHFDIQQDGGIERIKVSNDGGLFLNVAFKTGKLGFPVGTWFFKPRLVQMLDGQIYLSDFSGSGRGHLADVTDLAIDSDQFPNVEQVKPLGGLRINNFHLWFGAAQTLDAE
jgi:hypothetical protein